MSSTDTTSKYVSNSKKANDKTSVWHYFLSATDESETAKCKRCPAILRIKGGSTKGLLTHLLKIHKIDLKSMRVNKESDDTIVVVEKQTKLTDFYTAKNETSFEAVLARMTALDGIPFAKFITSKDLRDLLEAKGFKVPNSAATIKTRFIKYSNNIRLVVIEEIIAQKQLGKKFTLTFDEWTSTSNKHFMNINVHSQQEFWNLGLIRFKNSMTAEACVEMVKKRISEYKLSLSEDIVCITTDGASTMMKVGKLITPYQQFCMAHGIQLAVIDVLYNTTADFFSQGTFQLGSSEESEGEEYDVDDTDDIRGFDIQEESKNLTGIHITESYGIHSTISKVRKLVKCFKRSPTKNDILQNYVRAEHTKELKLILDCRTRWSSLFIMLQRFFLLKNSIKKATIDLNLTDDLLTDAEFNLIGEIVQILDPIKTAVEALCQRDMNLYKADIVLKFMLSEIGKIQSPLSTQLEMKLRTRIDQRRTVLSSIISYLHVPTENDTEELFKTLSRKRIQQEIYNLIKNYVKFNSTSTSSVEIVDEAESEDELPLANLLIKQNVSLKEKLKEALEKTSKPQKPVIRYNNIDLAKIILQEMEFFENGTGRGFHLQLAYDMLMTIPPTSVEAERTFSIAGILCSKIRSSLSDDTLDHLIFLRNFFKKQV